jgi:hypothetical protein
MHILPELRRTKQVHGGGTFHTAAVGFYQIYTLHFKVKEKVSSIIIFKK